MEIPLKATVVIPTRNRSEILEESLSFLAFQDFSTRQFEVLVCDDGSEEDIGVVVDKFRSAFPFLRLLKQDAKGPAAARNLGISEASAPIVIFLDSDVLSDKSLVRHLVRTLDENPQWLGSEARIEPVGNDRSPLWESPICKNGGHYHTAAVAYRREVLIEVGGLDETFTLPACEDVELAMQILSRGTIGFVPEAVVYHPCRRVNLGLHWRWRRYWKYEMILAKRYGVLSFPGHAAGKFPRFRVALAAVVTLPGGRFLEACKHMRKNIKEGNLALFYALFDVVCGLWALPDIFFRWIPPRINYLEGKRNIFHNNSNNLGRCLSSANNSL